MNYFELRKGQIIKDEYSNLFLVLSINGSAITCMNQKFNEVKIGLAYLNDYSLYDELDISEFVKWIESEIANDE